MRVAIAFSLALLLAFFLRDEAEAKGITYLLTGGELAAYAMVLPGFIPDDDGTEWGVAVEGTLVSAPVHVPSLGYDLYRRYGNFAIPHQMFVTGPELRYYPELRLIHHVWSDSWYDVLLPAGEYLDAQIEDALAKKAGGELEDDAFVADLRARQMHEVSYWLRPYARFNAESYSTPYMGQCSECTPHLADSHEFVMEHLVLTVSQPPQPAPGRSPGYVIEYEGWFGSGGIGGLLGAYSVPKDGEPGLFWPSGYGPDVSAYQTTPEFDAVIAEALQAKRVGDDDGTSPATEAVAPDQSHTASRATAVGAGLAGAAALTLAAASVLVGRRLQHRGRKSL